MLNSLRISFAKRVWGGGNGSQEGVFLIFKKNTQKTPKKKTPKIKTNFQIGGKNTN